MAKINFNRKKAAGVQSKYGAVPKGFYEMVIEKATVANTHDRSSGELTKQIMTIQLSIHEGTYKNRKIFVRFNLVNPSERAEAISAALLASIADAVGIYELEDTDELIGKHVCGEVVVVPPKNGYGEGNDVIKYHQSSYTEFEHKVPTEFGFEGEESTESVQGESSDDSNKAVDPDEFQKGLEDFDFDFKEDIPF